MIFEPGDRWILAVWFDEASNCLQASITTTTPGHEWKSSVVVPAEPFETTLEVIARARAHVEQFSGQQLPLFPNEIIPFKRDLSP